MTKKPISPKPTQYRNILFRSVLEARTAVLLDNVPNVLNWQYEPHTFTLSPQNWEYTPDFQMTLFIEGSKTQTYMEVKPGRITQQYRNLLTEFSNVLRHPLILLEINYYECFVDSLVFYKKRILENRGAKHFLSNFNAAFLRACNHRFDLR